MGVCVYEVGRACTVTYPTTTLIAILTTTLTTIDPHDTASRLMNVCHQTPLTDDEVGVVFRWLDPKGLGAVSREDLQARLDGFVKQEEVTFLDYTCLSAAPPHASSPPSAFATSPYR